MEGMVKRINHFVGMTATTHARRVQAVAARMVAYCERKRKRVFDYDGVAAHVCLASYAAELVHAGIRANVCAVCEFNVACERCAVRHDDAVAQTAVVRDVRLRHYEAIVANLCEHPAAFCAAMNGDELAYGVSFSYSSLRRLAPIF